MISNDVHLFVFFKSRLFRKQYKHIYIIKALREQTPGARFSKAPESFRARKAIFKSSVSKNGEVYTLETSCMKGTSLHL